MRLLLPTPSETQIQQALIKWWAYTWRALGSPREERLFAVANGGDRHFATAGRLKGEGVRRGVADLILMIPRGGNHALVIEMKKVGGRVRPEQLVFLKDVATDGYATAICYSLEEAIRVIETYMRMK